MNFYGPWILGDTASKSCPFLTKSVANRTGLYFCVLSWTLLQIKVINKKKKTRKFERNGHEH